MIKGEEKGKTEIENKDYMKKCRSREGERERGEREGEKNIEEQTY